MQITDLKLSVDLLEKERDFYFGKLRDIEILCQASEIENLPVSVFLKIKTFLMLTQNDCIGSSKSAHSLGQRGL